MEPRARAADSERVSMEAGGARLAVCARPGGKVHAWRYGMHHIDMPVGSWAALCSCYPMKQSSLLNVGCCLVGII
jgi:hypothetical protein